MSETNDFDLFIGLVLARLYDLRPKEQTFNASDFIEPLNEDGEYDGDRVENWVLTMSWLKEEAYIRINGIFSGNVSTQFGGVRLTEKGFRALNSLPSHLKGSEAQKSFGHQLIDLGRKTSWKAAAKISEKGMDEGSKQASHAIGELIKSWFS